MINRRGIVVKGVQRMTIAGVLFSLAVATASLSVAQSQPTRQASLSGVPSQTLGQLHNAQAPVFKAPEVLEQPSVQQPQQSPVVQPQRNALQIVGGQGEVIPVDQPVSQVLVADPNIADVRALSPTMLYVFGNRVGRTNIFGVSDTEQSVVFSLMVEVVPDAAAAQQQLLSRRPDSQAGFHIVNGALVAEGVAADVGEALDIAALSNSLASEEAPVVNNTVVEGAQQVNIRVRFAEVSRNDLFRLGINWEALVDTGDFLLGLATGGLSGAGFASGELTETFGTAFASGDIGNVQVDALLDALQREGIAQILAEPNLTAMNGQAANFLAGGEVPIPVAQGDGGVGVTFKPFGVSLDFLPTLLPGNRINLRVRPEVSQLVNTGGVVVNGVAVPAFTVRRAETSLELASGQTFALGGMFQRNISQDVDKFPILGDLPIMGALFQSPRYQRAETELVILITPYLVQPMRQQTAAAPTDRLDVPKSVPQQGQDRSLGGFIVE